MKTKSKVIMDILVSRLLNTIAKISIFMLYEFKAFDLSYWTVLIDNSF